MSHELYKKYRPRDLEHVVGNGGTVEALKRMIRKKRVPHTTLFSGPSGCGKTTLARILSTEVGCGKMDLTEINCSESRGIDMVRQIQSTMRLQPIGGTCRVWILDEAHQMTGEAQNALLKPTEDTPDHVYFMFCTTDPGKLISTIRNRCSDLPVSLLGDRELSSIVSRVCRKESIALPERVASEIVSVASGSARKALVLLDKVRNLDEAQGLEALWQKPEEEREAIDLCRALLKKEKWSKIQVLLKNLKGEPESVRWAVMGYARSVLLSNAGDKAHQAYLVICAFESHFFDSKLAGLARACYEATHG